MHLSPFYRLQIVSGAFRHNWHSQLEALSPRFKLLLLEVSKRDGTIRCTVRCPTSILSVILVKDVVMSVELLVTSKMRSFCDSTVSVVSYIVLDTIVIQC